MNTLYQIRKLLNRLMPGAASIANVTASTLAILQATHAQRTITLNRAAGIAVTLPAAIGQGAKYRFFLGTSITSNSTTIKVANAADTMAGSALLLQDGGDTVVGFAADPATTDTITLNGSTTGGLKGAIVELEDVAANLWAVRVVSDASGVEATPFSATVA